jgi:hypothetical protein
MQELMFDGREDAITARNGYHAYVQNQHEDGQAIEIVFDSQKNVQRAQRLTEFARATKQQ